MLEKVEKLEDQILLRFDESNLLDFLRVSLAQFRGSFSFKHALEDSFILHKLVIKDIFCRKQ